MVNDAAAAAELIASCQGRVLHCSDRNACDVELLLGGELQDRMVTPECSRLLHDQWYNASAPCPIFMPEKCFEACNAAMLQAGSRHWRASWGRLPMSLWFNTCGTDSTALYFNLPQPAAEKCS